MAGLLALIIASLAGWLVHALVGDHVSFMTDFVLSTIVSSVVYVFAIVWLRRLRGG